MLPFIQLAVGWWLGNEMWALVTDFGSVTAAYEAGGAAAKSVQGG